MLHLALQLSGGWRDGDWRRGRVPFHSRQTAEWQKSCQSIPAAISTPVRGKDGKLSTQANCSPYGLISFGTSVWWNAEETIPQHENKMQFYGTGPLRLAFSEAKGFIGNWLSCRLTFLGHLRGILKFSSNNCKMVLMVAGKALLQFYPNIQLLSNQKGWRSVWCAPPINPSSFMPK